ncbi:lamina-associated polypeptide 2-like isoform X2 [Bufo gargarizans]|uniref:lamina-associated polypeptide 2-like n=1 Tax=Bufo gargarizans TaxID=30331 RepID=UPI001CF5FEB6|nr:lamina-associated polypeptide 2-like [Bufo gargarizans]XP_044146474.1 lamina-associated polypeptide 2-like isoform X2 [Bufo gargarizans]
MEVQMSAMQDTSADIPTPSHGEKDTTVKSLGEPKKKPRRCALCSKRLGEAYIKALCSDCLAKILRDEQSSLLADLRVIVKEEIQAASSSVAQKPCAVSPPPKRPRVLRESDSEEEGLYLSEGETLKGDDDQGSSHMADDQRRYFFSQEDLDPLLSAVRQTMDIEEEEQTRSIQDEMFGGLKARKKKLFPVNENLKDLVIDEWADADKRLYIPREFKNRLLFNPEDTKLWDVVPKVDIQVAKVVKRTTLPFEDSAQLKEPMDRKIDGLLKRAWEVSANSINTNIAATSVARSLCLWVNQLEEHLRQDTPKEEILASLPLFKMAASFVADASAESIRFAAKTDSLTNTARRALWLKPWSGDIASKNKLCALPLKGSHLFGPVLDEILEKTADRKKGFPEEKGKKPLPFRKTTSSFQGTPRGKGKTGRWSYPKGGKGRGFLFNPNSKPEKQ